MNVETEKIDCYDPLTNKWEEFAPLPLAIEGMGVAVIWHATIGMPEVGCCLNV